MKTKFNGFTLAEVLITLVIIGVIAAITVPTLMQSTQKQEFVTGIKKAHSVLNQAMYRIGANSGYPGGDYEFFKRDDFIDEFSRVANVVEKCPNINACWDYTNKYKRLNLQTATDPPAGQAVITADGFFYAFQKNGDVYGLSTEDKKNVLGRIMVDVNGQKKPNRFGYDTYFFYIVDGRGLVPAGEYTTADCTRSNGGWSCAAKVLRDGQIRY